MPKYYIDDGKEYAIMDASNPISACVLALISERFSAIQVNGNYRVSEKGFSDHKDDYKVDSNLVNEILAKKMGFELDVLLDFLEKNPDIESEEDE